MHLAWFPVPVPSTCRCTYILPCVYAKTHRDTHWYPLFQHDALISISHPSHRVALVVVPGKSPRPLPFLPTRRPHLRGKRSSSPSKVRRGTRERTRRAAFISLSLSRSLAHLLPVGREDLANGGIYPTRWFFRLLASCVIYYSSLFFLRSLVDFLKFGWILIHEWEGKRTIFEWICIKDILEWTNWINF